MANCSWVQFSLAEKMVISWIVSVAENATESNLIETAFISSRIPSKTFSVNPYEPVPDELKFKLEKSNSDSRSLPVEGLWLTYLTMQDLEWEMVHLVVLVLEVSRLPILFDPSFIDFHYKNDIYRIL